MTGALLRYSPLLLLALAWEGAARFGLVSTAALPPLTEVLVAWFDLVKSGELITNGLSSLWRSGAGLGLSIVVGGALGIFMAWWRPVNALMSPLVEMFYPVPKSALIPVTAIWLGLGDASKILLIFLGCMIPVTIGAFNGARGSDQALVWTVRSMGASRLRALWDVVVPSAHAGAAQRHPHRACALVRAAGELRADRRAARVRLPDRISRRRRRL